MYIKNIMKGVNNMKLIVGLGNPGEEYDKTRHNVGYMLLDYLMDGNKFLFNKKNKAFEYETIVAGEKILFIKPTTFMNFSGEAVLKYVKFYKLNLDDILVIQDDLDIDIGKYKLIFNHGDGGHNGIKNIINCLASRKFLRLKVGISKTNDDTVDYVLGKFNKKELEKINEVFIELKDILCDFVKMNQDLLIGKYNTIGKKENK